MNEKIFNFRRHDGLKRMTFAKVILQTYAIIILMADQMDEMLPSYFQHFENILKKQFSKSVIFAS